MGTVSRTKQLGSKPPFPREAETLHSPAVPCYRFGREGSPTPTAPRPRPRQVVQISASSCAFAAVRADGRVVTWGDAGNGGDSGQVQDSRPPAWRASFYLRSVLVQENQRKRTYFVWGGSPEKDTRLGILPT